MALKRHDKETLVQSLKSDFEKSQHAILVDFRGISVPAVTEFRRKIRLSGANYKVIKNTLAVRALEGTPLAGLKDKFLKTTAIAYCDTDPVALAKVVVAFSKDHPQIVVKSGLVSGSQLLDESGVKALSTMPGLLELRASLLGVLMGPAAKLVRLLNTPAQQMVRVLRAHEEKQAERSTEKQAERSAEKQAERSAEKQAEPNAEKQAEPNAEKQSGTEPQLKGVAPEP